MQDDAGFDSNLNPTLVAIDMNDVTQTVAIAGDPDTGRMLVSAIVSSGSIVGTTPATLNHAQQTVNTTAVQLSAVSTVPTNGILVGALSTNSASIFAGAASVTTSNGVEILPGGSQPFTCNLNTIYIISAASTTDKVWYNVL